jgi:hypothetical protein
MGMPSPRNGAAGDGHTPLPARSSLRLGAVSRQHRDLRAARLRVRPIAVKATSLLRSLGHGVSGSISRALFHVKRCRVGEYRQGDVSRETRLDSELPNFACDAKCPTPQNWYLLLGPVRRRLTRWEGFPSRFACRLFFSASFVLASPSPAGFT